MTKLGWGSPAFLREPVPPLPEGLRALAGLWVYGQRASWRALLILLVMSWMLATKELRAPLTPYLYTAPLSVKAWDSQEQPCWRLNITCTLHRKLLVKEHKSESEQRRYNLPFSNFCLSSCCEGRGASWARYSTKGALFYSLKAHSVPGEPPDIEQALTFVEWAREWVRGGWNLFVL